MRSLRTCLTRRLAELLAHFALHDEIPEVAAAEAMRRLNRHAKRCATYGPEAGQRWEIYELKTRLIAWLLDREHQCKLTATEQSSACWSCYGTGTWRSESGRHTGWCYRCSGTGVYRSWKLLLFAFTIGDRRYAWHQPAEKWPLYADVIAPGPADRYEPSPRGELDRLAPLAAETLLETVAQLVGAERPRLTFRGAIARDWEIASDRLRWRFRRWHEMRTLRRKYPNAVDLDEELPF